MLDFRWRRRHNRSMKSRRFKVALLASWLPVVLAGFLPCSRAAEKTGQPRIDVVLWFDTEDYLLPADDDAAKPLAEFLTEPVIPAAFKIVCVRPRPPEPHSP